MEQTAFSAKDFIASATSESRAEIAFRILEKAFTELSTAGQVFEVMKSEQVQPFLHDIELESLLNVKSTEPIKLPDEQQSKRTRLTGEALRQEIDTVKAAVVNSLTDGIEMNRESIVATASAHIPKDTIEKRWNQVIKELVETDKALLKHGEKRNTVYKLSAKAKKKES